MQFSPLFTGLALYFTSFVSAQYGQTSYHVSDCDGVTNAGIFTGSPATINAPQCVTWSDPNFEITEFQSDADGFSCESKSEDMLPTQ